MYVCICRAVTDSAIRQAAADGVRSFRELSAHTGCSTQCGRCVPLAREVLDEALDALGAPAATVELAVVSAY